jgi:hypothetical protein
MSHRPEQAAGGGGQVPRSTTRRWFLAGAAAVVLGGAGGAGAQLLHRGPRAVRPAQPGDLRRLAAALAAEEALVRDLDATTGGTTAVRRAIVQIRADHAAHVDALRALIDRYPRAAVSAAAVPSRSASAASGSASSAAAPRGTPRTQAQLVAAERHASSQAAARANALRGDLAALFASISACEATHAELLR